MLNRFDKKIEMTKENLLTWSLPSLQELEQS